MMEKNKANHCEFKTQEFKHKVYMISVSLEKYMDIYNHLTDDKANVVSSFLGDWCH